MITPLSPLARRLRSSRGFALLMTLTLLSFIVLLLVGLGTYTRIETSISSNMQRQAQARENALLALNIAVGQLQKHAGPDTRVTATGEKFGGAGAKYLTGVWDATATGNTAVSWLVSGSERPDATPETLLAAALDPLTEAAAGQVFLVGNYTVSATPLAATPDERARRVKVSTQPIAVPSVPGRTGNAAVGRYAWWIGDQGVKASVAMAGPPADLGYAPYSAELSRRRLQQGSLGAGAADANGSPVFEPLAAVNDPLVRGDKVATPGQLAFLRGSDSATTGIGLAAPRANFHAWAPNNLGVLANPKLGGLKQDLSLMPSLLGSAFAAWANYPDYMEPTAAPSASGGEGASVAAESFPISPAYGTDPVRRRYRLTPQVRSGNGSHAVKPVLSYFLLTFNVRTAPTSGGNPSASVGPLEVRARWMLSLWNPYTSALVPENLRIEVTGLPSSVRVVDDTAARNAGSFSLQTAFGSPLRVNLPWDTATPSGTPGADRQSWLPGRVYTWRSKENASRDASPPAEGYASEFYSREVSDSGEGVIRPLTLPPVDGGSDGHLEVNGSSTLRIRLYAVRDTGDVLLGTFNSPAFDESFATDPQKLGAFGYQFSYVFRLAESVDDATRPGGWLTDGARDFRRTTLTSDFFRVEADGPNPAAYKNYTKIDKPDRLLDRSGDSPFSHGHDVPLFELPRAPILSLGALQHFRIVASRPFMIGNPWGVNAALNNIPLGELFDRFFFSGLVASAEPVLSTTGDLIVPNPGLRIVRDSTGAKPTIAKVRETIDGTVVTDAPDAGETGAGGEETALDGTPSVPSLPGGRSSKFFLQAGAFNLNSTSREAWRAVLRSVRYPAPRAFSFLSPSAGTGTAGDDALESESSDGAHFFRFPQSAQETYKIDDSGDDSLARTRHFRQGMRTLTGAQVAALAGRIADLVGAKHAADVTVGGGPFRSVQEFLSPSALFAGLDAAGNPGAPRSLLEAAIAEEGINIEGSAALEFSSRFLTQADIMTALAPSLFARSDTFLVRAYGEALNQATGGTEGRAWCEAIVQRLPEYFSNPANNPADTLPAAFDAPGNPANSGSAPTAEHQLNKLFGRRFKVVSFRWLTRSDI